MAKKFSALRSKMSPAARARAAKGANKILAEMTSAAHSGSATMRSRTAQLRPQTEENGLVLAWTISLADVKKARKAFEANEPRDLFYRAATELVSLALRRETSLTVAEALAVLLQTWNKAYYQYRKFDNAHFVSIERLLTTHQAVLSRYRDWSVENVAPSEKDTITTLFHDFEQVLGPVGAAKALHLLAPRLFPLWDRAIAKAHELPLGTAGSNSDRYWRFVSISKEQAAQLARADPLCENPLKSIDEYNYCKHTKQWL